MSLETVCSLCSEIILQHRLNLNNKTAKVFQILAIIRQHFQIEVNVDHSTSICIDCWTITNNFHGLYKRVHRTQPILLKLDIDEDHLKDTGNKIEQNTIRNHLPPTESTNVEIDQSTAISEEESPIHLANNDEIDQSTAISKEKSTIHLANNDQIDQSTAISKEDESPIPIDWVDSASDCDSYSVDEITANKERPECLNGKEKQNAEIREYFSMNCDMCDAMFETLYEASVHYRQTHNRAGYLRCCNTKFFRRGVVLQHIQHHRNPSLLQCNKCFKSYSKPLLLRQHMMLSHGSEPIPKHVCEVCMKSFTTKSQLCQHRLVMHVIEEVQCEKCKKSFRNKYLLNAHVKKRHPQEFTHLCDVCAKTFYTNKDYTKHMRNHLKDDPYQSKRLKFQCHLCSKLLKTKTGYLLHMRSHTDTPPVHCTQCYKQSPNPEALQRHIQTVHENRIPKHECIVCGRTFTKKLVLKEHMAIHTGVDLYSCQYCAKTFKFNSNFHSHRKKEHFEQWMQDRAQR